MTASPQFCRLQKYCTSSVVLLISVTVLSYRMIVVATINMVVAAGLY
jgi:hypothetical protein